MIVNNANLITHWHSQGSVAGALVAIEGKSIVDFGLVGKLVDRYDDDTEVLDVSGRLVLPGMIDAGTRLYRSLTPGLALPWRENDRLENALDEECLYWSGLAGLLDALRSGVTTCFALVSSPAFVDGSLAAVARAFGETGMRGALAYVVSSRSDVAAAIAENARHLAACGGSSSERIRGLFGLDVTSGIEEEALARIASAAEDAGEGVYVLLEDDSDGSDSVNRLERLGVWSRGGVACYRGPMAPDDAVVFRDREVWIAHGAQSDILSGMGALDLARAASSGLRLALATDGCGASLSEELRVAVYRQRTRGRELKDAIRLACRAAFAGNGDLATRVFGPELGRIKPGARADLVVLDYRPPTPLEDENLPEHLFWGAARAPVHSVIVNGKLLYQNGKFKDLDEERIRARAREAARKLRERL
jgi:cytosine/adenosine deaminase-related metal-dependent hydrolase